MDHTLDVNCNKSFASIEDYKTIIYKYLDSRKDSNPVREILRVVTRTIFPSIAGNITPIHEILGHIYLSLAQDKALPAIRTFLESSPFQEGILSDDEIQILIQNKKEVVDFLCSLSLHSSQRIKRKIANIQPYNLADVVVDTLRDLPKGSVIYNPNAGINTYAISAPQFHFVGEESSLPYWILGQIRLFIHQIDADIKRGHSSKKVQKKKYDAAIIDTFSTGCVGFGVGNIEDQIQSSYNSLNEGGKLILHYSSEILSDTTTNGVALHNLRKWMIEEKCVSTIVLLPYDINLNGRITHSAQTALIILEKKALPSIRMVDASDAYIHIGGREKAINSEEVIQLMNANCTVCPNKLTDVAYDEISKYTNLLPTFYSLQPRLHQQKLPNLVALKDLLIPYKNDYINSEDEDIRFVYTNELSNNIATATRDFLDIEVKECSEKGTLLDKDNLLLVSFYSNVLKCSIFKRTEGIKVVCSNQILVFEVHDSISDIEFFVSELFEDYVQEQVKALCSPYRSVTRSPQFIGDVMINIAPDSNHTAVNRTLERKLKAQENIIKATGLHLERLQNKELNDFVHTMRVRKHAMAQVLNSVVPAIRVLKLTLEKNGGTLKSTDVILRRSGTTLEEYLDRMQGQIDRIATMVDVLTDDTIYEAPSVVSLYKLLHDYKEKLIEDRFTFTILRDTHQYMDFKLSIAPKDMYQLLDNIISNAKKYGFVQQDKEYVIQLSAVPYQLNGKDAVLISIMNNGEALAKGMTPEKVFVIGEHAGKGNGIGGWQMKNIVEHYGGAISLVNHTNEESYFKIEYEIVLPIIESYEV